MRWRGRYDILLRLFWGAFVIYGYDYFYRDCLREFPRLRTLLMFIATV